MLVFTLSIFPDKSNLFAGIFAIIVITTASLEKITMERRYSHMKENDIRRDAEMEMMNEIYLRMKRDLKGRNKKFK